MKHNLFKITSAAILMCGLVSCAKDLNRTPTNATTEDAVYSTAAGYKEALAKVYSSYALTSSTGASNSDLGGIDAGSSDFFRLFWNIQELPTDEAMCVWTDPGVQDFHNLDWTSSNILLNGLYNRSLYQIKVANSFIAASTDAAVAGHGITGTDATEIKHYRAEARFLRAYQYWVLMDLFANPPYITEDDPTGTFLPPQIKRAALFDYVVSELKGIDSLLVAPKLNEYGRADQAADWALLARVYLNAQVYLGSDEGHYTDAITYSSKVINAGFALNSKYKSLFWADNNLNNTEVILSINYDGVKSQNYGGTTFLINAAINGAMVPADYGVPNGGWGGNRSTSALPGLFSDVTGATDSRAMFYGTTAKIDNTSDFLQGLKVIKFTNMTSADTAATSSNGTFCSTDFPLFRLAEMYLVYAEAVLRGGTGGSQSAGIGYVNLLRERAYGNKTGDLTSLSLQDVLDERGRELYWEAFRRTDLIRYGQFTTDAYLWPWKAGVANGKSVADTYNIYPLPNGDVNANPNLTQNPSY